ILRRRGTSSVGFSLSVAMTYRRFGGNVARLAEYRENRFHDAIFTRPNIIFQRRTVRHRHVEGSNTPDRRLQLVKPGLDNTCSDLRGDTTTLILFMDDDDTAGFSTDVIRVAISKGTKVRGSTISTLILSFTNFSATSKQRCTIYEVAITVTSLPLRFTSATPRGMGVSFSGTSPLSSSS